jgi:hypothetical protein
VIARVLLLSSGSSNFSLAVVSPLWLSEFAVL